MNRKIKKAKQNLSGKKLKKNMIRSGYSLLILTGLKKQQSLVPV